MKVLRVLRRRPNLFFRLSGIRLADFEALSRQVQPFWLAREEKRLARAGRQRAIGGGMKYRLGFDEQLLLCLIYYRNYVSHVFLGLMSGVSSPTVCRRIRAMTQLLAGHFRMPERRVKLSAREQEDLLYLMIDCTERPVQRPQKPGKRKKTCSGKKKRHTVSHQIITDNNKRILAVGPAQQGRKHDKRIYDESHLEKPPDMLVLVDLGYIGAPFETPLKKLRAAARSTAGKVYDKWHAGLRIGVEHAIGRMKKFRIFAEPALFTQIERECCVRLKVL
jgi:hypothetical protein